jgi:hypothetical protein
MFRNIQVLIVIGSLEITKVQCNCRDCRHSRRLLYVDSLDDLIVDSKEIKCSSVYAL